MGWCRRSSPTSIRVYRTPYKSNMLFFVFTALFAAFVPGDIVGEMTSIGTLFAFMLVCAGGVDHAVEAAGSGARVHGAGAAVRGDRSAS